jgi:hypothetical protein
MSVPTQQAKVCIVCGKDCSTIDRVKDEQGRYTCKPCHDAKSGKTGSAPSAKSDRDIANLYERPQSRPCPQCDKPVPSDAEICVACGYNLRAGKRVKTKLGKNDPLAGTRAEEAAKNRSKPRRWWIAAVVAGFVGAAGWIGGAYLLNDAAPWAGAIVGFLCGIAVWAAAREFCGLKPAVIALSMFMVFGGIAKVGSAVLLTAVSGPKHPGEVLVTEDTAKGLWAREVAEEMVKNGKQLYWPGNYTIETAKLQDHFPPDVWTEAAARWEKSGQGWQQQYRTAKAAIMQNDADEKFASEQQAAFLARFDWMDAIYSGVGLVLAGALGAGLLNLLPMKR